MKFFIAFLLTLISAGRAIACVTGGTESKHPHHGSAHLNYKKKLRGPATQTPITLPDFTHDSWGGPDPVKWKDEAILANATSKALNEAWSSMVSSGNFDTFKIW